MAMETRFSRLLQGLLFCCLTVALLPPAACAGPSATARQPASASPGRKTATRESFRTGGKTSQKQRYASTAARHQAGVPAGRRPRLTPSAACGATPTDSPAAHHQAIPGTARTRSDPARTIPARRKTAGKPAFPPAPGNPACAWPAASVGPPTTKPSLL